jgi:hypothetical protein
MELYTQLAPAMSCNSVHISVPSLLRSLEWPWHQPQPLRLLSTNKPTISRRESVHDSGASDGTFVIGFTKGVRHVLMCAMWTATHHGKKTQFLFVTKYPP